ncbi:Uncharacterised protein [uncultured Clostridium sp.]|nr:Uncharacterised protein [uncultured Clostridium sp.]
MKVTLDEKATLALKDVLKDKNPDAKIRVYFAGIG